MLAQEYEKQLAQSTDEEESSTPLWEREPWNCNVDLIQRRHELAVGFSDGSVYDYETGNAYTEEQWHDEKVSILADELETALTGYTEGDYSFTEGHTLTEAEAAALIPHITERLHEYPDLATEYDKVENIYERGDFLIGVIECMWETYLEPKSAVQQ